MSSCGGTSFGVALDAVATGLVTVASVASEFSIAVNGTTGISSPVAAGESDFCRTILSAFLPGDCVKTSDSFNFFFAFLRAFFSASSARSLASAFAAFLAATNSFRS